MREFLTQERDRRIAEMHKLESDRSELTRRIEIAKAQLDVINVVIEKFDEAPAAVRSIPSQRREREGGLNTKTRLSPRWLPILKAAVQRFPNGIGFDQVRDIQRAAGQTPADTNNIRSHVWTMSKNEFYEKLGSGSFRATQKAADAIGLTLGYSTDNHEITNSESEAPNSSELFGAPKANGSSPLST
jgi:hypothetical protein